MAAFYIPSTQSQGSCPAGGARPREKRDVLRPQIAAALHGLTYAACAGSSSLTNAALIIV